MPPEVKKKRTCAICGTEHNVGEACPTCEWDQEQEEKRAKGELERERIRENLKKAEPSVRKKSGGGFWS
jgi:hypothetical protein